MYITLLHITQTSCYLTEDTVTLAKCLLQSSNVFKNEEDAVLQLGKVKGCEKLAQWVEPVPNHFWHCEETCDGDIDLLKVKSFFWGWLSRIH